MGDADKFTQKVCVQASAHVARAVGCNRAFPAVLDTLADLIKHYTMTIGSHAHAVAAHGGRTEVSAIDMLAAMKQLSPESVEWRELKQFAFNEQGDSWQQPFHAEIPRLPMPKRKRPHYATVDDPKGAAKRPDHIPAFLPPLPPKHTYKKSRVHHVKGSKDAKKLREKRVERQHLVQSSLNKLEESERKGKAGAPGSEATAVATAAAAAAAAEPPPVVPSSGETSYMRYESASSSASASGSSSVAGMSRADRILEGVEAD